MSAPRLLTCTRCNATIEASLHALDGAGWRMDFQHGSGWRCPVHRSDEHANERGPRTVADEEAEVLAQPTTAKGPI